MNGHSKGPWRVVDGGSPGVLYVEGPPLPITIITTALDIDFAGSMEREANAHLIAAAPESHEANCAFVQAVNDMYRIKPHHSDEYIYDEMPSSALATAYFAARAAIAKATGGSLVPNVAPREEHAPCPGCLDTECNGECMENL